MEKKSVYNHCFCFYKTICSQRNFIRYRNNQGDVEEEAFIDTYVFFENKKQTDEEIDLQKYKEEPLFLKFVATGDISNPKFIESVDVKIKEDEPQEYEKEMVEKYFQDTDLKSLDLLFGKHGTELRNAIHDTLRFDGVIINFKDTQHFVAWFPEQIKDMFMQQQTSIKEQKEKAMAKQKTVTQKKHTKEISK